MTKGNDLATCSVTANRDRTYFETQTTNYFQSTVAHIVGSWHHGSHYVVHRLNNDI